MTPENIVDGIFIEFSCAWTVPHPCFEPSVKHIVCRHVGRTDAFDLDKIIRQWNEYHSSTQGRIWDVLRPNKDYRKKLRNGGKGAAYDEEWRHYGLEPGKFKWR
ncbi:hypothetical protein GGR56DRAFT_649128 [Xylariaceae sp. FL0804]|nr:hypothetical protein GGR56DRAFT_649128 [Xylariaceae sp. FL0804]